MLEIHKPTGRGFLYGSTESRYALHRSFEIEIVRCIETIKNWYQNSILHTSVRHTHTRIYICI